MMTAELPVTPAEAPLFKSVLPKVRDLNIVFMCYRFGRRLQPFMLSLLNQRAIQGINLHVTFYYERDEDCRAMTDVLNIGGCADHTIYFEKRTEVLKRAKLFASHVVPSDRISHVIFTDCDLWFPPFFLRHYINTLQTHPQGYWSTYIKEIEEADAEMLLHVWRDLDEDTLRPYASRHPRYNTGMGMAGHFQCVPRELCEYPCGEEQTVEIYDHKFALWAVERSLNKQTDRRIGEVPLYHFGHPFSWHGTSVDL